jgi:cation:H+ antiporter
MTIRFGTQLAEVLQLSKVVVGIAVIAIGTSLPELVTSVIAAAKREPDLSVGNVIGSNLFNSLLVLPVSGLITPIKLPDGGVLDLVVSFALAVALIPVFIMGNTRLGRPAAAMFLLSFVLYLTYRLSVGQPYAAAG